MVHRTGVARITSPAAILRGAADPRTAVNLPDRILAVPGRANQPIRLGQSSTDDFFTPIAQDLQTYAQLFRLLGQGDVPVLPPGIRTPDFNPFGTSARPERSVSAVPPWVWWAGGGVLGLSLLLALLSKQGAAPRRR